MRLRGNWRGYRECHVASDWLLVYLIKNGILVLARALTGAHDELFGGWR
ncbi:type II toxin-antitoxin system YafQ family toxin [Synergistes jonesii]|nr:type II toxin-antitoxin system YafQ family toxin [Synergistes jonesii]